MIALTSLSPDPARAEAQREAVASWLAADLYVQSLNHPSEHAALAGFDVELVPCERTTVARFGKHCVPANALVSHLAAMPGQHLVLNSDIVLRVSAGHLRRFALHCRDGLGYLVKHNHDGDEARAVREPYGIDGFMLDGSTVHLAPSYLSMGQPVWDYWLPYEFLQMGQPLYTTDEPIALHRRHPQAWNMDEWDACAVEFCRLYPTMSPTTPEGRLHLFQAIHAVINKAQRIGVRV